MTRILIENIIVPYTVGRKTAELDSEALKKARKEISRLFDTDAVGCAVNRRSIDARHKGEVKFVYSVSAEVVASAETASEKGIKVYSEADYSPASGTEKMIGRPVVVGFGPAGMFCALALAAAGYAPIVYERGADVDTRVGDVDAFYKTGILNPASNVQFGAGGAGTFSDGKLTTRINDPLCAYVLKELKSLGAPDDIVTKAKPHVGTDVLREVVRQADAKIRRLGGEIRYNTRVSLINGRFYADGEEINSDAVVLAVGHSARDTYSELLEGGYSIAPKSFSAGVRIEHLQSEIDRAMYGELAGDEALGHVEYSLSHREGERGVYSFCMCPGGEVVAAASEEGGVVTNGMSRRARDGRNANAAIAVSVLPVDYGNTPAGAIDFQRKLERSAFVFAGSDYSAPVQTVGDLLSGRCGTEPTRVTPTYMDGRVTPCDLTKILPSFITDMLKKGLPVFGRKIKGFDADYVPLTGVETRTSAPVRILRGESFEALGHSGIYPCGEGAGYAGGIMSAAIDGLKVARAIITKYAPNNR